MPAKSVFPAFSIKEARVLADTVAQKNAGQPMRRLDVFEEVGKSADSGPSRQLVTSSATYGLTTGSYKAEAIALTPLGQRLSVEGDETAVIDAVLNVETFKQFFDKYKNSQLPSEVAGKSYLASIGVPTDRAKACWEMLLENGRLTGLIDVISGGERVLPREHAIERKFSSGSTAKKAPLEEEEVQVPVGSQTKKMASGLPSLNINLEIHLPADVRPEVYDAIFGSMRKHLIDAE